MIRLELIWHDYRYFPYEERLARREAEDLLGAVIERDGARSLTVVVPHLEAATLRRLTYFRAVVGANQPTVLPDQSQLEGSVENSRRQSTRYSAHGLHEYKGKFNPQMVRAIGNLIGLSEDCWILDPFAGSGTTLVEAEHCGWNAVGVDLNPLAAVIANAKLASMRTPVSDLEHCAEELRARLSKLFDGLSYDTAWDEQTITDVAGLDWRKGLPDANYLGEWFAPSVLAQLAVILTQIQESCPEPLQDIFRVALSDIARSVSLQDPGDLRIRRRKNPSTNYPAVPAFLDGVDRFIQRVGAAQLVRGVATRFQRAFHADSRESLGWIRHHTGAERFDAAITSPPYATALPYIDTQRLSLSLLGLATAERIRSLDQKVLGSREVRKADRDALEDQILNGSAETALPSAVVELCRDLLRASRGSGNGFRRQAVPAVVFRYFKESAKVLKNVLSVIQPDGAFALVVGSNRTTLGGEEFEIDTPRLLALTAEAQGWICSEVIELDAYPRYDLHSRNSIRSESLVVLEHGSD